MWKLLADRTCRMGRDIVAENDIVEGHGEGGTVGKVRDDEGIGNTSVLVDEDKVGDAVGETGWDEVGHGGVSAVEAVGIRKD